MFCHKFNFLSGLIGKFHIKFTVNNVFEKLVSAKKVQWSFQKFFLFTTSVSHLLSTIKCHKKSIRSVPADDI